MSYLIKLDRTFGVRLKRFLEPISVSDACSYDELEALKNYADTIIYEQCSNPKSDEDIDYFKRVGVYDDFIKPYLVTEDGFRFFRNETAIVYSCMVKPTTGDSVLQVTFRGQEEYKNKVNTNRLYFHSNRKCSDYIEENKPKYSEKYVKDLLKQLGDKS